MEDFGLGQAPVTARRNWRARLRAVAFLLVMGCAWGLSFSLAKIATQAGAHPFGLGFWQTLFGGLFLLALALPSRGGQLPNRRHLGFYLVCGLLGGVLPSVLFYFAAPRVPAGVLSISVATVPMLTFAAALALRIDRASPGRVGGLLLGVLAVLLIVLPQASLPSPEMVPWVLVAVLAASFYAAEGLYVALRRPAGSTVLALACGMNFMAAAILLPVVVATKSFVSFTLPWGELEWSVAGLVVMTTIPYAMYLHSIATSGPVFAAQVSYIVTLSGIIWGMAIFGERHSLWIWAALVALLAGLALVAPRPVREARRDAAP